VFKQSYLDPSYGGSPMLGKRNLPGLVIRYLKGLFLLCTYVSRVTSAGHSRVTNEISSSFSGGSGGIERRESISRPSSFRRNFLVWTVLSLKFLATKFTKRSVPARPSNFPSLKSSFGLLRYRCQSNFTIRGAAIEPIRTPAQKSMFASFASIKNYRNSESIL
jgi:hypothetical protein